MDYITFVTGAIVAGVPLVFVIIGVVEWLKKLGVQGSWLLVSSMVIGMLFGAAYMLSQERPPMGQDWWEWFKYIFVLVVYGCAMGLIASGLYDTVKGMIESAILKLKT